MNESSNENKSTPQAKKLFYALKEKGVPAQLEKWDRHKHIDIAVPNARVNIEIDGLHHNYDENQAFSDLQRTYYSFEKGYVTLRIPNSLIENRFEQTVVYVVDFIKKSHENLDRDKRETKTIDIGEEMLLPTVIEGAKAIHRTLKWINKKRKEQPTEGGSGGRK